LSWDGDKVGSQQGANHSKWLEKLVGFISTKYNKYISETYPGKKSKSFNFKSEMQELAMHK